MSSPVKLYVYDLSNGLAKQLSMQLTGKQINGIWHTSVVVFGREVFYGQGISTTKPGMSHHGQPLQVVDVGETMIDEETFDDYLNELREIYTADKYHLLEFNCNSFTDDVVGFLVGKSIPNWIKDLPSDFLSTPFGQSLRPMIDNMFRRPSGASPISQPSDTLASSLLQSVASQAAGTSSAPPYPTPAATPKPQSGSGVVAGPLQICTNLQHFQHILRSHRAVAAFFTSKTCPPCRIVEPTFEDLAYSKASSGIAFAKIDISSMLSQSIAREYGIRATPTFLFFVNGKKEGELKGANVPELKSQVDLMIFQAFPPHPHSSKNLPKLRSISMDPIVFSQVPAFEAAQSKLLSFIDASISMQGKANIRTDLQTSIIPFLKSRFDLKMKGSAPSDITVKMVCGKWAAATTEIIQALPQDELFPLIDLWRLGLLDTSISSWCATCDVGQPTQNPILHLSSHLAPSISNLPKPVTLTTLRMLSNAFANVSLGRSLLSSSALSHRTERSSPRQSLTSILITSLLNADVAVRTAASSLAFNVSVTLQKPRVDSVTSGRPDATDVVDGDVDWEMELISAIIEAIRVENGSEDVIHRLTAALAFFAHLAPGYSEHLQPLLEVLQVKEILLGKLKGGPEGFAETGVGKKDVRELLQEVANELC